MHAVSSGGAEGTWARQRGCSPKVAEEDIGRIPYFFSADLAKPKAYYTGVKTSPQTGGNSAAAGAKWDLTKREIEVLELLRTGASDKEIANSLGVSRFTASKHVENILKKMKVTNRTAAVSLSWSAEDRLG